MIHSNEQQSECTEVSFEPILLAPQEQIVRRIPIAQWFLNRRCGEASVVITNRRVVYRSQTEFIFFSRSVQQEAELSSVIGVQQKAGRQIHWWIVIVGSLFMLSSAAIDYYERTSLRQLYSFSTYCELPLFSVGAILLFAALFLYICSAFSPYYRLGIQYQNSCSTISYEVNCRHRKRRNNLGNSIWITFVPCKECRKLENELYTSIINARSGIYANGS